jgi:hypothetical protein
LRTDYHQTGQRWERSGGGSLALSGNRSRAQTLLDDLQKRFPENSSVRFSYVPAVQRSTVSGLFGALYPVYVRGLAYLAARKGVKAAAEFLLRS